MDLINLLIFVIIFAAGIWGAFYICDKAGYPPPVRWVVGAVLLVILLIAALSMLGVTGDVLHRPILK